MVADHALTEATLLRAILLPALAWHLAELAAAGRWSAACDRAEGRLGRYGMGRN